MSPHGSFARAAPSSAADFAAFRARRRRVERVLLRALGAAAIALGAAYAAGLLYLLARGGARLVSFTTYATPLSGIDGEKVLRSVVAAAFGAAAVSTGFGIATALFGRAARGPTGRAGRVARWLKGAPGRRARLWAAVAAAALLALAARDHVPRFLISMPRETQAGGGVGPEMFNTIYFAVLSTLVTAPVGVGAALYLARFARSRPFTHSVRVALDTLSSLPSIVYGLFGFLVFVVQMRAGYSLLAGAYVLALLNLPLVVGIAEEAIRAVPREIEDASFALGATRVQTMLRISLPYAWPGILSAIVLSIGRVFAESAPLIMTAGTTVSRNTAYSLDPMRGGETLAVHLWYVNSAGLAPDKADVSAGTAALLVVLVAATNLLAARLGRFGGAEGGARLRKQVER